jgi:uncharacterized protein
MAAACSCGTAFADPDSPLSKEGSNMPSDTHQYTNRLKDATSPYLLQHAHNPVDWYPWGEEAFAKARNENKPIFLSIGYSACHWCHVMERESFENEAIARFLKEHFVSVKVDREERPDVDEIYMMAVQMMTGSGGWPMTVFLTPDLKPFYGGTYYPPVDSMGRPGFLTLLTALADAWENRSEEVFSSAEDLTGLVVKALSETSRGADVTHSLIQAAVSQLESTFDSAHGGFGHAPKFPSSPAIRLLLREYARTGRQKLLEMATVTLDKMAYGGMYDQLGGGFARYSVDNEWLVPHFEKMLYDNGQLAQAYLEAYQLTHDPLYRRIATEIFEYELRDMRDARGGFHSAEDADSEGQEGKFYIWSHEEIMSVLGQEDGNLFTAYYNVQPGGNFNSHEPYHKGLNILHMPVPAHAVAAQWEISEEDLEARMEPLRAKLLALREKRVRPGLDDKVLVSWNALLISALAQGHQVLREDRYLTAATEAAHFILTDMVQDGRLLRTYRQGKSHIPAYLDDYAFFVAALIDLYETTFDLTWIEAADEFTTRMITHFWDEQGGVFFFTMNEHDNLLVRARPTQDGAIPSGNSVAALALLRLARLLDNQAHAEKARRVLQASQENMQRHPRAFLNNLLAADFLLYPPREIAIVGDPSSQQVQQFLQTVHGDFVPNKVLALLDPQASNRIAVEARIPLLSDKTLVDGSPAVYVCRDFTCEQPVTDADSLETKLGISPVVADR